MTTKSTAKIRSGSLSRESPHQLLDTHTTAGLSNIWLYIANESDNPEFVGPFIDSLTERLCLLALHSRIGRPRDYHLRPESAVLQWVNTSCSIASKKMI